MTAGTNNSTGNDFYCSQKFTQLSVDLEKNQMCSCCSADMSKIPIEWVKSNPGKLFNTISLQEERTQMLNNLPVESCERNCWTPERKGLTSRRLKMNSNIVTHTSVNSDLEQITVHLGSDCNLTCVYCCKQYSSAWKKDIVSNGTYNVLSDDDRFAINAHDILAAKISQKDIRQSSIRQTLLNEIVSLTETNNFKSIEISGGEPFLNLNLMDLVNRINRNVPVIITTGLGVDEKRFETIASQLANRGNVSLSISAETTGALYEVIRYGNTWERFEKNLNTLQQVKVPYKFGMTLSNLTIFGVADFIHYIGSTPFTFTLCQVPSFMALNVLDDVSKDYISTLLLPSTISAAISKSLGKTCTESQRRDLSVYVNEYCRRRNLELNVFPESFRKWIE